ncbi:hypothetical protein FHS18_004788 [Paenibacillus phyllosphaerae]|uniref:Uncharacterized protein n=1 Tax=Paenibacillus phyllosphaerae TaxID=274593 RepID=A0A7W5B1J3_9BACL|nr:hypothetical protein [Paenibacillus phyllosphaerae]MBB3112687.1 hypothetical protein [Paenibacillus phyllosphaerae]
MSAKLKIKNVRMAPVKKAKTKSRSQGRSGNRSGLNPARVSDCCGHGQRQDNAVLGIQEAGRELGEFFGSLEDPDTAARLVRAIRCKQKRVVEDLLGPDCQVVCFFNQGRYSCVRITCVFGTCCDVRITFDICVSGGSCGINFRGI